MPSLRAKLANATRNLGRATRRAELLERVCSYLLSQAEQAHAPRAVTQKQAALEMGVRFQVVNRLMSSTLRKKELATLPQLRGWLLARGECPTCVVNAESADDFLRLVRRHVIAPTRRREEDK